MVDKEQVKLIVVRHCEAMGNDLRIFQGSTDCDITENGARQLDALAERMREFPFQAAYSSPLKRAYKTAQAANRYYGLPIKTEARLAEIHGGCWEGKKWGDFPKLFPRDSYHWNNEPWKFHPDGGESMKEVYDRIWEAVTDIASRHFGQSVLVASHGCAIRNLLCHAHGWEIERLNDVDWCDNTAISVIEFDRELRPTILLENDSSHLTEHLSTFAKQSWWRRENCDAMQFE